jgi:prepilin-type N-terminal cleavage/methylation domain-containing protein
MQTKFDLDHSKLLDRQNLQGYTMLEILAVLSLVGILTAIAVPSLLSMQGANNLNSSVEKVRATLELSQTTAIQTGDPDKPCKIYIPDGSQIVSECLIAADRTSSGIRDVPDGLPQVNLDDGVTLRTVNWTNSSNPSVNDIPAQVIYNLKGITQSNGTIILESSATANKKCLVVSAGVGLIRNGLYQNNTCEVTE